jgi:hypothetical protein
MQQEGDSRASKLLEWLWIHPASYPMCDREVKGERASRRLLSMKTMIHAGQVSHYSSAHDKLSFEPNSW